MALPRSSVVPNEIASRIPSGTRNSSTSQTPPGSRKLAAKRRSLTLALRGLDLGPRAVPRAPPVALQVLELLAVLEVGHGHLDRRVVLDQAGECVLRAALVRHRVAHVLHVLGRVLGLEQVLD